MWSQLNIPHRGTSTTRLRVMMLRFETYQMDLKHTMVEHLSTLSTMICDLKAVGNNLSDDQQYLLLYGHYLIGRP